MRPTPPAPEVLDWLQSGDLAVQFQVTRDVLGHPAAALQARIAHEGAGAALLAARRPDGHWGEGFYQPKWTSSHYTLLELAELGLDSGHRLPRESVALILATGKGPDGGLDPTRELRRSDACVNGMGLRYGAYFGAPTTDLASIVDLLLGEQMSDGGFNCRRHRSGAKHGSVHTSVCVLEGFTTYAGSGHQHRLDEVVTATAGIVDFFLSHQLYRSHRTRAVMNPEFTRLHHPPRWHFDVLRGLQALAEADVPYDDRMAEGLQLLRDRRRADGRWVANRSYPGATHVPLPRAGQPNRWVTLRALRVLATYPQES